MKTSNSYQSSIHLGTFLVSTSYSCTTYGISNLVIAAKIVTIYPITNPQIRSKAIQYRLAKYDWNELAKLLVHLASAVSGAPNSEELLLKGEWSMEACIACKDFVRTSNGNTVDYTPSHVVELGVCVLVRCLWTYFRVIAGAARTDRDSGDRATVSELDSALVSSIPYMLIYDFGDEVKGN